jgi:hypothetical protein
MKCELAHTDPGQHLEQQCDQGWFSTMIAIVAIVAKALNW